MFRFFKVAANAETGQLAWEVLSNFLRGVAYGAGVTAGGIIVQENFGERNQQGDKPNQSQNVNQP